MILNKMMWTRNETQQVLKKWYLELSSKNSAMPELRLHNQTSHTSNNLLLLNNKLSSPAAPNV